jgi:hypothetical protein
MRHLVTLAVLTAVFFTVDAEASRGDSGIVRLAQNTTPVPLPAPTLPVPGSAACSMSCNTQVGACQGICQAISSGAATTSSTIVGVTTNPTQCYLNCTSQQMLCQQSCPH